MYLCSENAVLNLELKLCLKEVHPNNVRPSCDALQDCVSTVEGLKSKTSLPQSISSVDKDT